MQTADNSQFVQCPVDKCGRRFEDEEKMRTHIQRRHPEYQFPKNSQKDENPEKSISMNPNTKKIRNNSRDNLVQQPVIKNVSSHSKERNASLSSNSSSQINSTERSFSKEISSSRVQQRPPTPKSALSLKGQSIIQGQQINNTTESMRRSQDLFKKTQENNQLIEKTAPSSSKERTKRSSSQLGQKSAVSTQQDLKQLKSIQNSLSMTPKTNSELTKDSSIKKNDKNERTKSDSINLDQQLIQSILFSISQAEKKEQEIKTDNQQIQKSDLPDKGNKIQQSSLPNEEVLSESDDDNVNQIQKQNIKQQIENNEKKQTEKLSSDKKGESQNGSQVSLSSSNQGEQKNKKQVNIQEIIECKKKICCEYLLEHSSNECDDIGFIESLTLNEQNLIVFEDGLTDAKFDLMVSLQYLSLSRNSLINIVSLSKFSESLQELNINFNQVSDINPLYECYNLEKLWASHNQITSITCLKKLKNLKILSLYNNQISICVDTLKELQNLQELDLAHNPCSTAFNYKYDILSVVKLQKLDSEIVTPQDIQISKTFASNKTTNNQQSRPGSAPLQINPRTGLSASMIVNNQIKENEQKEKSKGKNKIKEQDKHKMNNNEYQKTAKIQELEKKLSEIQQRQLELKDGIRQTKKINKSLAQEIEEKEKENIVLREQSGQIEALRQGNKTLLKKISAYESTLILHQESPEELKSYLRTLKAQVDSLEEQNNKLHKENEELEKLENDFIDDENDQNSDDSDYNPEKINELLMRSTAAFSQIKQDLKVLNKVKK